jgi:hypothetical protein
MTLKELERRLIALEQTVALLQAQVNRTNDPNRPWWQNVAGSFANDPVFEEIVRLGREYRESLRPGAKKKAKKSKRDSA